MAREYQSDGEKFRVATKLGDVYVLPVAGDDIYVTFERGEELTVNGVQIHGSMHVLLVDGAWTSDERRSGQYQRTLYAYRGFHDDISEAARKKILDIVPVAVAAWADANADKIHAAALREVNNRIHSAEEDVAKAEKALLAAKMKLAELLDEERAIKENA